MSKDKMTSTDPANDNLINTAAEVAQAFAGAPGGAYDADPLDGDKPVERLEMEDIVGDEGQQ
ncbi:MAG TPA: hypothetical protein VK963_02840 [Candidatus Saccharimonadales bacterium]|nr:hypothetical protein [Candidatus Saccharimonadales bacterium]